MSDIEVTPAWHAGEWEIQVSGEGVFRLQTCDGGSVFLECLTLSDLRAIRALCDRAIQEEGKDNA